MPRVFISYRREDSSGYAGRLSDRLEDRFGKRNVFMDMDSLAPGVDFIEVINSNVGACDVLLAIIGKNWLSAKDDGGRTRLESPEDFVRLEISAALKRGVRVIPLLVGGAQMPRSQELPEELAGLARRQALIVHDDTFRASVDWLIQSIEECGESAREAEQEQADQKAEQKEAEQEPQAREAADAAPERDASTAADRDERITSVAPGSPRGFPKKIRYALLLLVFAIAAAVLLAKFSFSSRPHAGSVPPDHNLGTITPSNTIEKEKGENTASTKATRSGPKADPDYLGRRYFVDITEVAAGESQSAVNALSHLGVTAEVVPERDAVGNISQRVQIRSGIVTRARAEELATRLRSEGYPDAKVRMRVRKQ